MKLMELLLCCPKKCIEWNENISAEVDGWVGLLFLIFGGLWPLLRQGLRQKEENKQTNQPFSNKLKKESELMKQNEVNLLMELIY